MKVAICIATYRRPAQLHRLLRSLDSLELSSNSAPELQIVVVDNDPARSAEPVIRALAATRFPIVYYLEPRPGISFARNAAIGFSRGADYVAFIDDDEHPSPEWLDRLIAAQLKFNAPIVAGPVIPAVDHSSQAQAESSRPARPRRATGTLLKSAGAGNVLISASVLRAMGPPWFDPRFGLTGGEDTHFFRRCLAAGFRIAWADEAIVYEVLSPNRLTSAYACARARNGANHWTRVEMELDPSLMKLARRFTVGLVRIAQGGSLRLFSARSDEARQMHGKLLIAEGVGNLYAFFGGTYEMYGATEQ